MHSLVETQQTPPKNIQRSHGIEEVSEEESFDTWVHCAFCIGFVHHVGDVLRYWRFWRLKEKKRIKNPSRGEKAASSALSREAGHFEDRGGERRLFLAFAILATQEQRVLYLVGRKL